MTCAIDIRVTFAGELLHSRYSWIEIATRGGHRTCSNDPQRTVQRNSTVASTCLAKRAVWQQKRIIAMVYTCWKMEELKEGERTRCRYVFLWRHHFAPLLRFPGPAAGTAAVI